MILLLLLGLAAADESFPSFEAELTAALAELSVSAQPREVQKKFFALVGVKNNEVNVFIRKNKDVLEQKNTARRKAFEDAKRAELAEWEKANPKGDKKPLRDKINKERQALGQEIKNEKAALEAALLQKKKAYDAFVTAKKREFNQRFTDLNKANKVQQAIERNAQDEFKDIPKNPGIILAPGEQ